MPRYAAVDIGSNSIRMLAAEVVGGMPRKTLASSRQVTRLGEGVFRTGRISQSAMDLSCNVLAQMAADYKPPASWESAPWEPAPCATPSTRRNSWARASKLSRRPSR